jgi:uroporphyrinogen decarboxylase
MEIEAKKKLGIDALSVSDYHIFPPDYRPKFISNDTYVDLFGRIYRVRRDVKTTWWVDGAIKTSEDLDNWDPPDPDSIDYSIVDLTVEQAGDEYPVVAWIHGSMMFPYLMRGGIDKLVYDIYRQPDFARKLIRKVADVNFEIAKRIMDRGVDLVAESDDIADCKTPFFNLKIFREFFFPYLKRLIDECHRRRLKFMKHSDGNLYPLLDDLVALGVDGLHPIEPNVMDLVDVKRRYSGRLFLRGNVDCTHVLPNGTVTEVRRDVRRCIDAAARGGGFILADSNSMHSNVRTENIWVMIDEGRKYGEYPIRRES